MRYKSASSRWQGDVCLCVGWTALWVSASAQHFMGDKAPSWGQALDMCASHAGEAWVWRTSQAMLVCMPPCMSSWNCSCILSRACSCTRQAGAVK